MTSQFKDIVPRTQTLKTVKCIFCGVWVQIFVWHFKGTLWNLTQNLETIQHKIGILQGVRIWRIMISKSYALLSLSETGPCCPSEWHHNGATIVNPGATIATTSKYRYSITSIVISFLTVLSVHVIQTSDLLAKYTIKIHISSHQWIYIVQFSHRICDKSKAKTCSCCSPCLIMAT